MEERSGSVQPLHLHRDREELVFRPAIEAAGHIFEGVTDIPRSSPQDLLFYGLNVIWMKEGFLVIIVAAVRAGREGLAWCAAPIADHSLPTRESLHQAEILSVGRPRSDIEGCSSPSDWWRERQASVRGRDAPL